MQEAALASSTGAEASTPTEVPSADVEAPVGEGEIEIEVQDHGSTQHAVAPTEEEAADAECPPLSMKERLALMRAKRRSKQGFDFMVVRRPSSGQRR